MLMDRRFRLGRILGLALLATLPVLAQSGSTDPRRDDGQADDEQTKPLTIGIQLTSKTLESLLDKAADRLAGLYGFDEYQKEEMRQLLHDRVPRFLQQHQDDLQRLINEWVESMAAEEPPEPEFAAEWAQRALPIVDEFTEVFNGVADDMRGFLDDEQEVMLDGYVAIFETGRRFTTNRLQMFADGGFDFKEHWPRSDGFEEIGYAEAVQLHQEMEEARATAMAASAGGSGGRPRTAMTSAERSADTQLAADATPGKPQPAQAGAKDEWTRYVEWFIQHYRLDDEQRQKAEHFLEQQIERRERHYMRSAGRIKQIKSLFKNAKTEKQLALAKSAHESLNEPVARMFEKLKQKLDTLPTREQRRLAAEAAKKEPDPREAAAKGAPDGR